MDLIKINKTEKGMAVDGRELHEFLEVGRDFSTWIQERIRKYGFIEGEDFSLTLTKTGERQNVIRHNYELSIEMAKELCMVENNEKGSQARKYFIDVEKRYKSQAIDISLLPPEMQMFKQLWDGLARTQIENARMTQQLAETTQKVEEVGNAVSVIKETLLQRDEDWRKSINHMLNAAAFRLGGKYQDLRNESYRMLEDRAHCKLSTRLKNLLDRLEETGATKTKINQTTKMDVIESEPRLKEIYSTIVKELSIGSLKTASY